MNTTQEQPGILRTIEQEMDTDMHPVLKKILEHIKPIGLGIGILVAGVAIYAWFSSYQEEQAHRIASQLGQILVADSPKERISQLTALQASAPQSIQPAIALELAKSYLEADDFAQAERTWQALATQGLADVQEVARLGEAKSLIMAGKYAEAAALLRTLKAGASDEFISLIANTLAFAEEQAGNTQAALAEYQSILDKEPSSAPFIEYKITQLKQKNGQ
ncbi:hypothetical protein MASR1M90_20530 [Desulfovibrionales bacterium]